MNSIGIDLGSRFIKLIKLNEKNEIIEKELFESVFFYQNYGKLKQNVFYLEADKLGIYDGDRITTTGYGKHNLNIFGMKKISEQKAHVQGAVFQFGKKDFILLDIGGQDTKVIEVIDEQISDIFMNDKCGASSGRYLENMARVLSLDLEEFSKYDSDWIDISSTCAIFGESEVLGKVFEGVALNRIIAGINYSLCKRITPILERYKPQTVVFTGGLAKHQSLVNIIRKVSTKNVIVPAEPHFNGALGAAVNR